MSWIHSAKKNQLIALKPIREVDMIMQKEQLVAGFAKRKVTTKAIAAAVEASTQIDLTDASTSTAIEQPDTDNLTEQLQDMLAFIPAEEVQLASTERFWTCFPSTLKQTVLMPKARM
ncbi:TPA: hypothetical protein ACH3X1_002534 [Trebouxia sp. C0004]